MFINYLSFSVKVIVSASNECSELVLRNGQRFSLDVQLDCSGKGESVLHVLYGHSNQVCLRAFVVCKTKKLRPQRGTCIF